MWDGEKKKRSRGGEGYIYIYRGEWTLKQNSVKATARKQKENKRDGDRCNSGCGFSMTENPHFELPNVLQSVSNFKREFDSSKQTSLWS